MEIVLTREAQRDMGALVKSARDRIMAKIRLYADNPASLANQVKRLKGSDFLRLRVGDYRVLFTKDGQILNVIKVGHRREVYD